MAIKADPPHTYGWLRRPELDVGGRRAWERPDGRIIRFDPGVPEVVYRIVEDAGGVAGEGEV